MNPETATPELNKALVAAQAEMPAVPFDSKNPFFSTRYASLGSVIATSRPILAKHGLAIEQKPYSREGRIGVKTIMRHVSGEYSESELDMPMAGEKSKSAIQEAGSIITYLRRYAWSAVCGLYADEDTDGNGAETTGKAPASSPKPQTAQRGAEPTKAQPAPSWTKRTPNEQKEHLALLEAWLGKCKTSLLAKLEPVLAGAREYAAKSGMILPNELLQDATLGKLFPSVDWNLGVEQNKTAVKKDFDALMAAVQSFMDGDQIPSAEVPDTKAPRLAAQDEWFMDMIVPIPHKGQKRDEYLKAPDTIRSLFDQRHGTDEDAQLARGRLYGFLNHYQPNGWVKKDGTQMPPSDSDKKFREALDALGEFLEKTGEKL